MPFAMRRGKAATLGKMRSHGWVFVRDAVIHHGRGILVDPTQKIPILSMCSTRICNICRNTVFLPT